MIKITGIDLIAKERQRQKTEERHNNYEDSKHEYGQLANAAAYYATTPASRVENGHPEWPWDTDWCKPTPEDRQKELIKAGALIAAELDRINEVEDIVKSSKEKTMEALVGCVVSLEEYWLADQETQEEPEVLLGAKKLIAESI